IRDYKVTGVQTCALPIYDLSSDDVVGFDNIPHRSFETWAGVGDMEHPGEGKRHLLPIDDDHVDDGHLLLNLLNYSDNRGTFFRDDDKTCRSFYTDNVSLGIYGGDAGL